MKKVIRATGCPHFNFGVKSYLYAIKYTAIGPEWVMGPDKAKAKDYSDLSPEELEKDFCEIKKSHPCCTVKIKTIN